MRIAISAGHGKGDPGTVNERLGLEEHAEAVKVAEALFIALANSGVACVVVPFGVFTLKEKIATVNDNHGLVPIDQAIEIHFNANEGAPGHGTEVLYQSPKNKGVAANVSRELSAAIGTFDRGAKKPARSLGWLKQTKPPALIIEVLFLNNDDEAAKVNDPTFAERAAVGIVRGLLSENA